MQWVTLLNLIVNKACTVENDTVRATPGGDPEGWIALEEMYPMWDEDSGIREHVLINTALMEDVGFLKRRIVEGRVQCRPTFRAIEHFRNWPGIDPSFSE